MGEAWHTIQEADQYAIVTIGILLFSEYMFWAYKLWVKLGELDN